MPFPKGNKYRLGKNLTPEQSARMSKSLTGRHHTEETKAKMRASQKGKHNGKFTAEHLANMSKSQTGKKASVETRLKMRLAHLAKNNKGRKWSEKTIRKQSEAHKGNTATKGKKMSTKAVEINRKAHMGLKPTDETKLKMKRACENNWKKPEYAHNVLSKVCQRPNKQEMKVMKLLNEVAPNEYKYTGDGSFSIYNLHPDFTNINGQKKVIEHYGSYWHRGENPQDRIDKFAEFGFLCLVIWEHELKYPDQIIVRIKEFHEK